MRGAYLGVISLLLSSCIPRSEKPTLFAVVDERQSGLDFENVLTPTPSLNMFKYMYFYNGAGVGAGDFDNDGRVDLFFASNQGNCEVFLNKGGLTFSNVTNESGVNSNGWSTGVSVVDINHDGWLDVYVCKVSSLDSAEVRNELWVNKGVRGSSVFFQNEANAYRLDFSGNSTQAAFFDFDLDGDLDLYLLNHAPNHLGTFGERYKFLGNYDDKVGDKLFRNDKGIFTDVTRSSKINSSPIGFGLGLVVSDINLDGWPDIYVGNDFHENDYLYINQKDGTFKDEADQRFMHTSMYTMGVDIADFNNDLLADVASMDMLPDDPYMIRRSLGEDDYDIYYQKVRSGYDYQYTRNNLQLNRGNGKFSEIGVYGGIHATDWSWSTLWLDFDNDGWKDLFVSNGIPKRMNDIDYVNFVSNSEIQEKLRTDKIQEKDLALVNKFPEIKLKNKFFLNNRDLTFLESSDQVTGIEPTFSNGAVYADLDNDGDLDIVTNNIGGKATLYENHANESRNTKHYISIQLKGDFQNPLAFGTKIFFFSKNSRQYSEYSPVRGFLSSMAGNIVFGTTDREVDSIRIVWPDLKTQMIQRIPVDTNIVLSKHNELKKWNFLLPGADRTGLVVQDLTRKFSLQARHQENTFPEFTRELLVPRMMSTEGPALAVADINNDGLTDVFLGSSKSTLPSLWMQTKEGNFREKTIAAFKDDELNEEVSAVWVDVNGDKFADLVTANGGNEFFGSDSHLVPCVYLNDGKGELTKKQNAFDSIYLNASVVTPADFDDDGDADLFIGARSVPWEYGTNPSSYLLRNDGTGRFQDVTSNAMPDMLQAGMITYAQWVDLDHDKDLDLVTCSDWGTIDVYTNSNGIFSKTVIYPITGWWNFLLASDFDHDGDVDIVAGNQGLNSRLRPSTTEPVRLYLNDFDGNGRKEQLVTYYLKGKEIPFMGKGDLQKILPMIKKKFLFAEKFADAPLNEIFTNDQLNKSKVLTAQSFESVILVNDGKGAFFKKALPPSCQWSPIRAGVEITTSEGKSSALLFGNFYQNNIQLGRNDSDFGNWLLFQPNGDVSARDLRGDVITGQVRNIGTLSQGKYILAINNDSLRVIVTTIPQE
jgi:hypothetical protein